MKHTDADGIVRDIFADINAQAEKSRRTVNRVAFVGAGCFSLFFMVILLGIGFAFWKIATFDYEGVRHDFITECHDRGWHVAYQAGGQMICQEPGINVGLPQ